MAASFPLVQFAPAAGSPRCRNLEFPGRHVAKSLHLAQAAHAALHGGRFATAIATPLNDSLCNRAPKKSDTCDLDALRLVCRSSA